VCVCTYIEREGEIDGRKLTANHMNSVAVLRSASGLWTKLHPSAAQRASREALSISLESVAR